MVLLTVTLRCDHPGCNAVELTTCEPMAEVREAVFPFRPPKMPSGWHGPVTGSKYNAPVFCPKHGPGAETR